MDRAVSEGTVREKLEYIEDPVTGEIQYPATLIEYQAVFNNYLEALSLLLPKNGEPVYISRQEAYNINLKNINIIPDAFGFYIRLTDPPLNARSNTVYVGTKVKMENLNDK